LIVIEDDYGYNYDYGYSYGYDSYGSGFDQMLAILLGGQQQELDIRINVANSTTSRPALPSPQEKMPVSQQRMPVPQQRMPQQRMPQQRMPMPQQQRMPQGMPQSRIPQPPHPQRIPSNGSPRLRPQEIARPTQDNSSSVETASTEHANGKGYQPEEGVTYRSAP